MALSPGHDGRSHIWFYSIDKTRGPWPDGCARLVGDHGTSGSGASPQGTKGVDWVKDISEKPLPARFLKVRDPGGEGQKFLPLSEEERAQLQISAAETLLSKWPDKPREAAQRLLAQKSVTQSNSTKVLKDLVTVVLYKTGLRE